MKAIIIGTERGKPGYLRRFRILRPHRDYRHDIYSETVLAMNVSIVKQYVNAVIEKTHDTLRTFH